VDVALAREGFTLGKEAIQSGEFDMVILDELNIAIDFGLISLKDVLDALKEKAQKVDVILTGRYASKEIIELADTVSEVKEIKHHYSQGIKERAGIEF
jgi:cob(I)alamin adenosyltransferase